MPDSDEITPDSDTPRCPKCGYTYEDCVAHGDHHLCGETDPPRCDSDTQQRPPEPGAAAFTLGVYHACLTGDCPHDEAAECVAALLPYIAEICEAGVRLEHENARLRGYIDHYREEQRHG